jgi:hypothetical protein
VDCDRRRSLELSPFVHHYTEGEEGGTDSRCVSTSFEFQMDDPEQWLLSDSEEEEGPDFDPYQCDPQFESEKELNDFLATCDTGQATESDEEDIDYKSARETEKICSCGLCDDIKSTPWPGSEETFEHICCQQTDRWKDTVSEVEAGGCTLGCVTLDRSS